MKGVAHSPELVAAALQLKARRKSIQQIGDALGLTHRAAHNLVYRSLAKARKRGPHRADASGGSTTRSPLECLDLPPAHVAARLSQLSEAERRFVMWRTA